MGACGSRDAIKSPARDLSKWRASNDGDGTANDDAQQQRKSGASSTIKPNACAFDENPNSVSAENQVQLEMMNNQRNDLAFNCVTYHPCFAGTQQCLTGWEDDTIKKSTWQAASLSSNFSDSSGFIVTTWKPHERAVNRIVVGKSDELICPCSRDTTIALTSHIAPKSSSPSSSSRKQPQPVYLRGHTLNVSTIAVNDDETSLCSGGRDTQTIFWDLTTGRLKAKNTTSQNVITCSKWIPAEPLVVQGSEDSTLKLWDERTNLRAPVQSFHGYVYFALCVDVSPDGNYFLTSSKGFNGVGCEVRVWDRRAGKQLHEFNGHQQDTTSCCFLPSAAGSSSNDSVTSPVDSVGASAIPIPVTASKCGSVKVWDVATSSVLCEALEPSGKMFTSICAVNSSTVLASTFAGEVHQFAFNGDEKGLHLVA
ncbi:Wd repeat-containing protein 31-like, partial [Globisporangium splendens]